MLQKFRAEKNNEKKSLWGPGGSRGWRSQRKVAHCGQLLEEHTLDTSSKNRLLDALQQSAEPNCNKITGVFYLLSLS